ncbi:MAG: type VI secretion system baseplate subunit TssF [Planctomycetota bacterium]
MKDRLLQYFRREITSFDREAEQFARQHPSEAEHLRITTQDPSIRHLFQANAFLNARTRLKLDDSIPELSDTLVNILYPHYLAPIPSLSLVRFEPPDLSKCNGERIERKTLIESKKVPVPGLGTAEEACVYRTTMPVDLWPIKISGVSLEQIGSDREGGRRRGRFTIALESGQPGTPISDLGEIDYLRFYLGNQNGYDIYEGLFRQDENKNLPQPKVYSDQLLSNEIGSDLPQPPKSTITPVGFGTDERLIDEENRVFDGYQILTEYFLFPRKFLFFDLQIPPQLLREMTHEKVWVSIDLSYFSPTLSNESQEARNGVDKTVMLGCTPAVNLFEVGHDANDTPAQIYATKASDEHKIIPKPERAEALEVYSIDGVQETGKRAKDNRPFRPLFSLAHGSQDSRHWYHTVRRTSADGAATDVFLSLVDLKSNPIDISDHTYAVKTTCTNRNLPAVLRENTHLSPDFRLKDGGAMNIHCEVAPTIPVRPSERTERSWAIISHIALGNTPLIGKDASPMRELLRLYCDFGNDSDRDKIDALTKMEGNPGTARIVTPQGVAVCRGTDLEMTFARFPGVFVFASVLAEFFELYASANSFIRVKVSTTTEGAIHQWQPRLSGPGDH